MTLKIIEIDGEKFAAYDGPYESWWLTTPWGCGWIGTCNKRVFASAPIFRKLGGWDLRKFPSNYIYEKLCDETEASINALARRRTKKVP